jgi:hypothetical protein
VSFGQFTKELAKQAIGSQVQEVVDSLKPADSAPQAPSDNPAALIFAQVQAMQNSLKDDQELIVLCRAGQESMRALEFYAPSPRLVVVTGVDADRTVTRMISAVESLQLICKPVTVPAGGKPARIRFVTPKPKP